MKSHVTIRINGKKYDEHELWSAVYNIIEKFPAPKTPQERETLLGLHLISHALSGIIAFGEFKLGELMHDENVIPCLEPAVKLIVQEMDETIQVCKKWRREWRAEKKGK